MSSSLDGVSTSSMTMTPDRSLGGDELESELLLNSCEKRGINGAMGLVVVRCPFELEVVAILQAGPIDNGLLSDWSFSQRI